MCQTDRECIEQCLGGERDVFGHLIQRYQGAVLSYLAGHLGGRDRAEEAAQETFVRAYFGLGYLRRPEMFFSWLLGIARRVAREQRRAEWRRRQLARVWAEKGADPELSSDCALERAVAGLPHTYREVVLLRYYGSLSCAEVAERLNVPLGTVTKQLSRAYGMLREALRGHGSGDGDCEVRA